MAFAILLAAAAALAATADCQGCKDPNAGLHDVNSLLQVHMAADLGRSYSEEDITLTPEDGDSLASDLGLTDDSPTALKVGDSVKPVEGEEARADETRDVIGKNPFSGEEIAVKDQALDSKPEANGWNAININGQAIGSATESGVSRPDINVNGQAIGRGTETDNNNQDLDSKPEINVNGKAIGSGADSNVNNQALDAKPEINVNGQAIGSGAESNAANQALDSKPEINVNGQALDSKAELKVNNQNVDSKANIKGDKDVSTVQACSDTWDPGWGSTPSTRCLDWSQDSTWGALAGGKSLDQACSDEWAKRSCAATCGCQASTDELVASVTSAESAAAGSSSSAAIDNTGNGTEIVGSAGAHHHLALQCVDGTCSVQVVGKNGTNVTDPSSKGNSSTSGPHVALHCAGGSCSVHVSGLNKTSSNSSSCFGCNRYLMTVEDILNASAKGAECVYDPKARAMDNVKASDYVNKPLVLLEEDENNVRHVFDTAPIDSTFGLADMDMVSPATNVHSKPKVQSHRKHAALLELFDKSKSVAPRFFPGGHREAGDNIRLSNGFDGAKKMTLPNNFKLSYGDILSLCGDFYGNADKGVISSGKSTNDRETRFATYTWGCLAKDKMDPNRLFPIATNDLLLDHVEMPANCSQHGSLASADFDHFAAIQGYSFEEQGGGLGAWEAYSAGHSVACKSAAAGKSDSRALETALMQNACASHFLSDLFASGHLRTPRRFLGRATSFWMENEDHQWGLNVSNKNGDTWRAYGNTCHAEKANKKNSEMELATLKASAEAVLSAWTDGDVSACQADEQVDSLRPNLKLVQDPKQAQLQHNGAPMFVPHNKARVAAGPGNLTGTSVRGSVCDMDKYHHSWCWDWRTIYNEFAMTCPVGVRGEKPFLHKNCHDPAAC